MTLVNEIVKGEYVRESGQRTFKLPRVPCNGAREGGGLPCRLPGRSRCCRHPGDGGLHPDKGRKTEGKGRARCGGVTGYEIRHLPIRSEPRTFTVYGYPYTTEE